MMKPPTRKEQKYNELYEQTDLKKLPDYGNPKQIVENTIYGMSASATSNHDSVS